MKSIRFEKIYRFTNKITLLATSSLLFLLVASCTQLIDEQVGITHVEVDPQLLADGNTLSVLEDEGTLADITRDLATVSSVPALATREAQLLQILASDLPILLLDSALLTDAENQAQQLAISDPRFTRFIFHGPNALPLRNEIMGIRPALPSDLDQLSDIECTVERCYRVEMYNYAHNLTTIALVDVQQGLILDVAPFTNTQPDIPHHLTELAIEIAIHAPEVIEALGFQPGATEATMPNIKTALNSTRCERSQHLCVAPTFLVDDRALWTIVDLTDGQLVGVRWTELGTNSTAPVVTEESLQNEVVSLRYCEQSNQLVQDGWEMAYMLTSSDGLRLSDVRFQKEQVMRSAKLVDWHVSYSQTDGFGYSDAVGCPIFSSAAIIAYNGPQVVDIVENDQVVGFALVQDFMGDGWPMPCHYRYEQRYEFYQDGRFRVGGANLGRGCGTNGVYRPVLRMDITAEGNGMADSIAEWKDDSWSTWEEEQWQLQDDQTAYMADGYQYRVTGPQGTGYFIEPGQGQFADGGRGDNAYLYAMARHSDIDEGEADLITIGSCCNTDHQQGPEQFIVPAESIAATDLVLWYVAQLPNDDTPGQEYCWADAVIEAGKTVNRSYPCYFGPMFVPTR